MKTLTSENAFGRRAPLRVRWMHENKQKCDSTEVLQGLFLIGFGSFFANRVLAFSLLFCVGLVLGVIFALFVGPLDDLLFSNTLKFRYPGSILRPVRLVRFVRLNVLRVVALFVWLSGFGVCAP